jgi:hypothetical protein
MFGHWWQVIRDHCLAARQIKQPKEREGANKKAKRKSAKERDGRTHVLRNAPLCSSSIYYGAPRDGVPLQ